MTVVSSVALSSHAITSWFMVLYPVSVKRSFAPVGRRDRRGVRSVVEGSNCLILFVWPAGSDLSGRPRSYSGPKRERNPRGMTSPVCSPSSSCLPPCLSLPSVLGSSWVD